MPGGKCTKAYCVSYTLGSHAPSFVTVNHQQPSLIFASKERAYP